MTKIRAATEYSNNSAIAGPFSPPSRRRTTCALIHATPLRFSNYVSKYLNDKLNNIRPRIHAKIPDDSFNVRHSLF